MSARFQKFLTAWQKARKGKIAPYRGDLRVLDMIDESRQIITIDMSRRSPRIMFAGSVASKGFEMDPIGEEMRKVMSPKLIDCILADFEKMRAGDTGIVGTFGFGAKRRLATMRFIALPLLNHKGKTDLAVVYGILSEAVANRADLFPLMAKANIYQAETFVIEPPASQRKAG